MELTPIQLISFLIITLFAFYYFFKSKKQEKLEWTETQKKFYNERREVELQRRKEDFFNKMPDDPERLKDLLFSTVSTLRFLRDFEKERTEIGTLFIQATCKLGLKKVEEVFNEQTN